MKHEKIVDSLTARSIMKLSRKIARRYGLRMPDPDELHKQYKSRYPLPCVTKTDAGEMWTDRYYLAYQLIGMDAPKYVYLTKTHILEEKVSYRSASKLRGTNVSVPISILSQFKTAYASMRYNGIELWLAEDET